MGAKLAAIFDEVKAKGGLNAQIKFAMLTKLSAAKAKETPDTPEMIKLFEECKAKV
jgi:hypothetical protein